MGRMRRLCGWAALFITVVISACGGGGGPDSNNNTTTPVLPAFSIDDGGMCVNAGLEIYNNANVLQIDANYSNLEFKGKYAVVLTSSGKNPVGTLTTPGYAGEVLAIGAAPSPVALTGRSNNVWSLEALPVNGAAAPNQTITVYLFAKATAAVPAHAAGLVVLEASGAVTYSSATPYMKVAWAGRVPDSSGTDVPGLAMNSLPSGTYAALLCSPRYGWYGGQSSDSLTVAFRAMDGVQVTANGGSVQLLRDLYTSGSTGPNQIGYHITQRAGGDLLLLDVSNL